MCGTHFGSYMLQKKRYILRTEWILLVPSGHNFHAGGTFAPGTFTSGLERSKMGILPVQFQMYIRFFFLLPTSMEILIFISLNNPFNFRIKCFLLPPYGQNFPAAAALGCTNMTDSSPSFLK